MRVIGKIKYANKSNILLEIDGDTSIAEKINKYANETVEVKIDKFFPNRSLSANGYYWKIVDAIAKATGNTPDNIHLWMIRDAGVMTQLYAPENEYKRIKSVYKIVEIVGTQDIMTDDGEQSILILNCWKSSTLYNTKEFARLIENAEFEAKNLDIDLDGCKEN